MSRYRLKAPLSAILDKLGTLASAMLGLTPALRSSHIEPGAAIKAGARGLTTAREGFSFQRLLVVV